MRFETRVFLKTPIMFIFTGTTNTAKKIYQKRLYDHNRNELIRKMKIKHPSITAD